MFKALLRFVLFFMPLAFLNGVSFILFDGVEIYSVNFDIKKRKRKNSKKQELKTIKNYLENCYKKDQNCE